MTDVQMNPGKDIVGGRLQQSGPQQTGKNSRITPDFLPSGHTSSREQNIEAKSRLVSLEETDKFISLLSLCGEEAHRSISNGMFRRRDAATPRRDCTRRAARR